MTIIVNGVDYPIIQIDYDDYAVIKLKTLQNVYPEYMYFDRNSPIEDIKLKYPKPS